MIPDRLYADNKLVKRKNQWLLLSDKVKKHKHKNKSNKQDWKYTFIVSHQVKINNSKITPWDIQDCKITPWDIQGCKITPWDIHSCWIDLTKNAKRPYFGLEMRHVLYSLQDSNPQALGFIGLILWKINSNGHMFAVGPKGILYLFFSRSFIFHWYLVKEKTGPKEMKFQSE